MNKEFAPSNPNAQAPGTEQSPESTTISGSQWNDPTQAEPFTEKSIIPEPWTDFPDEYEDLDESEPDIDGVPQTVWRGERLYLHNLDELNRRTISTKGHERRHNRDGQVYLARDKKIRKSLCRRDRRREILRRPITSRRNPHWRSLQN